LRSDFQESSQALKREVLERLFLGFEGTDLPGEMAALLASGLAGVAIYTRNYKDPIGLRALTDAIRHAAMQPVLIGIDQEGGSTRFALQPPFTLWPSPSELGKLNDAVLVDQVARAMSRELLAAGVNLDFAPMLDLATNPASPVTSGRSFGANSESVARMGTAFLRGIAAEGVLACAKHFPGHGDAAVDPHIDLPRFDGTPERLAHHELVPFAAAIAAGVPTIMTAHILLPQIDPDRPASISPRVLQDILRQQLRFDGVILADDLGMGAIARRYGPGESVVQTLAAGSDIAMLCHDSTVVPEAIEAVAQSLKEGRFEPAQWSASRTRIARLREQLRAAETSQPLPPLGLIGCAEHRALAQEIRARLAQAPDQSL
jgi:beta-N-acetylhexosaminidase